MSCLKWLTRPGPVAVGLIAHLALTVGAVSAQSLEGTVTYRERMALPTGALLEVTMADVSRAGESQGAAGATGSLLAGTSWQLVRFQGGDDTVLTPDAICFSH